MILGHFTGHALGKIGENVIVLKTEDVCPLQGGHSTACMNAGTQVKSRSPRERTVLDLEEMSSEALEEEEESTASRFAAAVLLNGRGQELAEKSLVEANYNLRKLKTAVQKVAKRETVFRS